MKRLYPLFFILLFAVSCGKEDPAHKPIPTPETVDLGLPSGTKWASFNIGAAKPEECGLYFAWGDVEGQTWDGTKWSGSGFYNVPSYDTDKDGNLKPEYDAAHVLLGGNWRMPTKTEQEELIKNCASQWISNYNQSGVSGRLFTSKIAGYTDKSIFLPINGAGDESSIFQTGYGYYWSSTFYDGGRANHIFFYSGGAGVQMDCSTRRTGLCIRPVSK